MRRFCKTWSCGADQPGRRCCCLLLLCCSKRQLQPCGVRAGGAVFGVTGTEYRRRLRRVCFTSPSGGPALHRRKSGGDLEHGRCLLHLGTGLSLFSAVLSEVAPGEHSDRLNLGTDLSRVDRELQFPSLLTHTCLLSTAALGCIFLASFHFCCFSGFSVRAPMWRATAALAQCWWYLWYPLFWILKLLVN